MDGISGGANELLAEDTMLWIVVEVAGLASFAGIRVIEACVKSEESGKHPSRCSHTHALNTHHRHRETKAQRKRAVVRGDTTKEEGEICASVEGGGNDWLFGCVLSTRALNAPTLFRLYLRSSISHRVNHTHTHTHTGFK